MGSIARMNRCERFIAEFGDDLSKQQPLQPGMLLQVDAVYLGMDPVDEVVKAFAVVKPHGPAGGDQTEVIISGSWLFEPESEDIDTVENTVAVLGTTKKKAVARLKKAGLVNR